MFLESRVQWYRALADPQRLQILDALQLSDHTPGELADLVGLTSNLLSFHLDVLEDVALVARHRSQGDGRRRYVTLAAAADALDVHSTAPALPAERVLFVCTHNAARSQLAAGMWTARTGRSSSSAGASPADRVHPRAVDVARRHGLDLADGRPSGYAAVSVDPDLVVSVCDRAREADPPFEAPLVHWSIPEPVDDADFPAAWDELDRRIERLARRAAA